MELSRHPGKAKEKSYLINDDTTKTKFFHVKFMEKLLNRDLVRIFFEKTKRLSKTPISFLASTVDVARAIGFTPRVKKKECDGLVCDHPNENY